MTDAGDDADGAPDRLPRAGGRPREASPTGASPDGDANGTRRSHPTVDRRQFLALASTGVAAAVAGCWQRSGDDSDPDGAADGDGGAADGDGREPGEGDAEGVPLASEYGTVVDVVADAGADPHAEESIVPVLEAEAGDDTLVYFPPGRYLMDDLWTLPEFEHLAVLGDDATIVPPRGYFGYLFVFGLPDRPASDLVFRGIDFDVTAPDTAPRPIQVQVDDGFVVADVTAEGVCGTARFDVTSPEGAGVVRNLEFADGGMEPNPVGILVGPANRGLVRFEECHLEGFPGNGLYASPSNGPVEVVGGHYANNGIASVRVSSPAVVRNVTVRCDEAPAGFRNMRGIRLRNGESVLVENSTVEFSEVTYSAGGIVVEPMMASATIRDVDVDLSVDGVPAINARSPRHGDGRGAIECERVSVTGDAAQGAAVRVVDRDDCRFERLDIEQYGTDRDGVYLLRSTRSVLRASQIDVTGRPVVLEDSHLRRVDDVL